MSKQDPFVHGSYPIHVHVDSDGEQWKCNSPYCEEMNIDPPDKGGPVPVIKGQEPWRGRQ